MRKFSQDHLELTTVVAASFCCSYALHVLMHCKQISLAELPDIFLTLACKSDVSDALPSHLVFDMYCGGLIDNQETASQIRFLCLALLEVSFNTAFSVLSPLLCLTRASRFAGS